MRKLFPLILMLVLGACKQQQSNTNPDTSRVMAIGEIQLPQLINLHPDTQKEILKWEKFQEFESSFKGLYSIENREDLKLVVQDLIEKYQELNASSPPEKLNLSQVKSRMVVVLTKLYLIKENLDYNQELESEIVAVVDAYNDLRAQMNSQLTNTLDTKTIEDD